MLIPYVKLVPSERGKKVPITSVRSGPTLDTTMATVAISMMLARNEFPGVAVRGSDISVRF
jgi:formylmethanofuran dehydrogenase subunit B